MSSLPGSFELPRRFSLSAQTTEAIRKGIEEATWREFLPSERRLCELFQVSRPTVRTALRQLAKEGAIAIQHGRRNRILATSRSPAAPRSRLVVLVAHQPISHTTLTAYQSISEMRAHLAEYGFTTEVLVCPARSFVNQRSKLESFLRQNRVLCFVLLSLGRELQEWFAMHSIPKWSSHRTRAAREKGSALPWGRCASERRTVEFHRRAESELLVVGVEVVVGKAKAPLALRANRPRRLIDSKTSPSRSYRATSGIAGSQMDKPPP